MLLHHTSVLTNLFFGTNCTNHIPAFMPMPGWFGIIQTPGLNTIAAFYGLSALEAATFTSHFTPTRSATLICGSSPGRTHLAICSVSVKLIHRFWDVAFSTSFHFQHANMLARLSSVYFQALANSPSIGGEQRCRSFILTDVLVFKARWQ